MNTLEQQIAILTAAHNGEVIQRRFSADDDVEANWFPSEAIIFNFQDYLYRVYKEPVYIWFDTDIKEIESFGHCPVPSAILTFKLPVTQVALSHKDLEVIKKVIESKEMMNSKVGA